MFSVAVSVPYNKNTHLYDMSGVPDSSEAVRDAILRCDVYVGKRVVAATVLKWPDVLQQCPAGRVPWHQLLKQCGRRSMTWAEVKKVCPDKIRDGRADHAEYRTLENFNALVSNLKNFGADDLLIFYVLASPCDQRCASETNPRSILDHINLIRCWKNYAFVFTNIFQPRNGPRIPEANLRGALERLATHKGRLGSLGLSNIFRCKGSEMQCTSCSSSGKVDRHCYSDKLDGKGVVPFRTNRVKA